MGFYFILFYFTLFYFIKITLVRFRMWADNVQLCTIRREQSFGCFGHSRKTLVKSSINCIIINTSR